MTDGANPPTKTGGFRTDTNQDGLLVRDPVGEFDDLRERIQALTRQITGLLDERSPAASGKLARAVALLGAANSAVAEVRGRLAEWETIAEREGRIAKQEAWPAQRPLVSVVVAGSAEAEPTSATITSLLAQSFRDLEIIVVGLPGSPVEPEHPMVRVFALPEGEADAWDYGVARAFGKYVACLTAGERLSTLDFDRAVFALEIMRFDVAGPATEGPGQAHIGLEPLKHGNPLRGSALFRRVRWKEAGGIAVPSLAGRPDLTRWAFWLRIAAGGGRIGVLPASEDSRQDPVSEADRALIGAVPTERPLGGESERRHAPGPAERRLRDWAPLAARFQCAGKPGPTVLVLLARPLQGGAEEHLKQLVASLKASGWGVIVAVTHPAAAGKDAAAEHFGAASPEVFDLPNLVPAEQQSDFLDYLVATRNVDVLLLPGGTPVDEPLAALKVRHPGLKVAALSGSGRARRLGLIDLALTEGERVADYQDALSRLWTSAAT